MEDSTVEGGEHEYVSDCPYDNEDGCQAASGGVHLTVEFRLRIRTDRVGIVWKKVGIVW